MLTQRSGLIETDGSNQEMVVKKVLINQQVDESDFEEKLTLEVYYNAGTIMIYGK
ncbi:hypothetical protein [Sphingobacterium pedocola]|uniref:hypothetical protein n=1 Tax=Sphingobacterium pedocola TaxID=2082722 RepID=UPI0018C928C7|nr:hypothetical protein [Sphingobacterium pedocola]